MKNRSCALAVWSVLAVALTPLSAQGVTSSMYASYRIDSIYNDYASGFADLSLYHFWVNPWDPTEDVTISCAVSRAAGSPNRFSMGHSITSYLQFTRTEVWASYDHLVRSASGHVSGTINLTLDHQGWGEFSVDLLGDGVRDWGGWYASTESLPAIIGSHGMMTKIDYYHEESGHSGNSIEFDPTPTSVLASEGAECGSSLSAVVRQRRVSIACQGLSDGVNGALVVGLNAYSLPIPYSNCLLGTEVLDVIPTAAIAGRGMATLALDVPPGPLTFRVQHLHFGQSAPGAPYAFFASNTLRVAMP